MTKSWTIALGVLIGAGLIIAIGCAVVPNPIRPATTTPSPAKLTEGKRIYQVSCTACHQANGEGMEGISLTLVKSRWVVGPESRLVRIVLHGVRGPIAAGVQEANLEMPAMGFFEDEEIAAVLTYIRNAWGNRAPAVTTAMVRRIREETRGRNDSWTVVELEKIR